MKNQNPPPQDPTNQPQGHAEAPPITVPDNEWARVIKPIPDNPTLSDILKELKIIRDQSEKTNQILSDLCKSLKRPE